MTLAVDARDLYRFYHAGEDETLALRGVSLSVEAGELVAIVGPSGSGKSTLLACLAGLDEPDGGGVYLEGERLSRQGENARSALRARAIGVLFQSGNLLSHLSVTANVLLAQRFAGPLDRARAAAVVESVGLAARANAMPTSLSGGETARAGLAVALANDPRVLLADEPTGELDSATADLIVSLLRERAQGGLAIIAATHNPHFAARADRIVTLADGRLAA